MTFETINDAATMGGGATVSLGSIDQYELVRELGGGGFGTVYLAKDTVSGIDVAVKGLPPIIRNNAEELERIRENFALVSRLHHPYIAAALHLHRAQNVRYGDESVREKLRVFAGDTLMVMEYAPGVTLAKWRRQFPGGKVPLEQAIQLVWQVAQALDFAHEQRILHRDVKPSNIMVETRPDGEVVARLLDFGLAAELRSSMGRVSREIRDTSGTRPYMAPEQWEGRKQGPATDQYALAVLLCELLTGEVPFASAFETGDPMVMMMAVCNREAELPAGCPRRRVLLKALSKDPSKRFASCVEFLEAAAMREQAGGGSERPTATPQRDREVAVLPTKVFDFTSASADKGDGLRSEWKSLAVAVSIGVACVGAFWLYSRERNVAPPASQAQAEASVEGPLLAPVRAPEPEDAGVKRQDEHVAADEEAQKRQAEEAERAAKEESERRAREEAAQRAREEAAQRAREEAEREEAERAAKEEADRVRGEAVALQAEVAKVAGADGFKDRKAQLDAVCVQADEAYKAKRWDDAKVKFEEYAEKSRNVLTLDGERHKADAARKSAAKEKKKAESYGAETHAAAEWGKALADWKRAVDEFANMEFALAETSFGDAADGFRRCVDRVIARVRRRDEIRREISASVGDVPRHGSVDRVLEEERRRAAAAFLERTAGANRCRHCGAVVRYQIAGRYCPACRGDLLED